MVHKIRELYTAVTSNCEQDLQNRCHIGTWLCPLFIEPPIVIDERKEDHEKV